MENTSRQKNMRHGAYVDIYQAIEEVKQRVPARVVVLWENARIAELPTLRNLTIDTVKDYVNRVLDFLYAANDDTPADVSRWLPTIESLTAELDEYTEKTPENLRQILEYMVTYASSAHEKVQREISQIYNVDPLGWPDAADDLQQHVSRRRLLSKHDTVCHSRTILSQHDLHSNSQDLEQIKKTLNTIPPSVLSAWRRAHSALSDALFLDDEAQNLQDLEKVETFGQETFRFIELTGQMFPDDQIIKESKSIVQRVLQILEDYKKYFTKNPDKENRFPIREYLRKIDFALDRVHVYVSQKTNTMKDSWYFTEPSYLKKFNITPTQQAEWELVKRRRGPRQLFMEELWQDLYKQERGASRRKNAAQLCAELRRRAGTVIQFDPKLEKDKKELLGIVDEILKTYTDIYDMSSVVLYALQALTTSPEMPAHISSLHTMVTHLQHSVEQLGEAF